MSFSNQVKIEICENHKMSEGCKAALLYGLLCSARSFSQSEIEFFSESREVAEYFADLVWRLYKQKLEIDSIVDIHIKELFCIKISDSKICKMIVESFNCGKYAEHINLISLDEQITWAYIKGIFLGCGSISDPSSDYHLEFSFKKREDAIFAQNMMSSLGFSPKRTVRRDNYIVYFKDSSAIEDVLAGVGAVKKCLELMDLKVIKDLRNRLNRRNNCETANIKRTVDVASAQIDSINYIIRKRGMDFLPDDLQRIAQFRLDNPEMSLKAMATELLGEFSKSGIDRRLKKIVNIAQEIKEKQGE